MIKIGIVGCGFLSELHLQILQSQLANNCEIVGLFDPDFEKSKLLSKKFNIPIFSSFEELLAASDTIDLLTDHTDIFTYAKQTIRHQKHVLIDRLDKLTPEETLALYKLSAEANVIAQYSHLERYNNAFVEAQKHIEQPTFIEVNRNLRFASHATDINVVLDLMIHDIDLVLSVVKAQLKKIQVSGSSLIGQTADVAHVRMEFNNGCVAVLSSNRMALKNENTLKVYQSNGYISIDLIENQTEIISIEEKNTTPTTFDAEWNEAKNTSQINIQELNIPNDDVIQNELSTFVDNILGNKEQRVTLLDGYHTLNTSLKVLDKLKLTPTLM